MLPVIVSHLYELMCVIVLYFSGGLGERVLVSNGVSVKDLVLRHRKYKNIASSVSQTSKVIVS